MVLCGRKWIPIFQTQVGNKTVALAPRTVNVAIVFCDN